jgi:adenosylmethionine-8-amino-7-oxononanoate aminotransferase
MDATARRQYAQWDAESLWHPYTRHSAAAAGLPLIVRGEGVYLEDAEGRRYFDAIASWWACALGHGHPRVVDAIVRQARELPHSILGNLSHPRAVELAHRLAALFPGPRRVFFGSDGASAVEAALKIAVQYWHNRGRPERCRFAALELGYHGDTLGAVSVGFLESFHRPFKSVVFPVLQAESPCCGPCRHGGRPETCGLECFAPMQALFDRHGGELAAVVVEPLCQCAAGMRIYSARYLRRLAELCAEREVLLIADEVAVGFGRTGRRFAFEHAGVAPDIVCVGKALSGGYLPISATVVSEAVYDTFADQPEDHTFYHGHTFAGNPIAAAAALAALDVYDELRIEERAAALGRVLDDELGRLRGVGGVRDVRCLGAIGAVELADSGVGTGVERAVRARDRLRREGVLLRPLGSVMYLMPPLIAPEDVLRDAARKLAAAVIEGGHERGG